MRTRVLSEFVQVIVMIVTKLLFFKRVSGCRTLTLKACHLGLLPQIVLVTEKRADKEKVRLLWLKAKDKIVLTNISNLYFNKWFKISHISSASQVIPLINLFFFFFALPVVSCGGILRLTSKDVPDPGPSCLLQSSCLFFCDNMHHFKVSASRRRN